jgi:TonB-dependent SusC/RagA subfamily outer membrane receptor
MIQHKIPHTIPGIIILLGIILFSFKAGEKALMMPASDIPEKLDEYYDKYPQQKVYMHLDKQTYHAGEIIWFKVYFLNAEKHIPSSYSNTLVVEVLNSFGNSILTRILKIEDGYAHGDFTVFDTIPTGLYEIRAYTNWMRNFGVEYFFRRQIDILNPEFSEQLYRDDKLANKKLKKKSVRKSARIDFQFFPEGGDLINGIESRVAFKAINELGLGLDVRGEIFNKKGELIKEFTSFHQGMGTFTLTPDLNEKYYALIYYGEDKKEKAILPKPLKSGYTIRADNRNNEEITVRINSTYLNPEITLIGHVRGKVYYNTTTKLESGQANITIPTNLFPTGILHLTLFDQRTEPQSERLVFINHNDFLNIDLETDKETYGSREKITLEIDVRDQNNNPVSGNFSLSVTDHDMNQMTGDFHSGITSYLLLSSDLKGRIENPEYYFEKNTPETRQALDYLMMTHGWRRFVWKNVVESVPLEIEYPVQKGLTVSGKITREFFNLPLKNLPVTMTILSGFNDVYHARTNDDGEYVFNLPDYRDTINIEITARRASGRKNLVISIDETETPESEILYSSYTKEMQILGTNVFKPQEEPEEDPNNTTLKGIYGKPDNVIYVDETLANYQNVFEIIKGRVPGVRVVGNTIQIRGPNSFLLSTEPLYLIDGVYVDASAIESMNPHDIERIEVLKGPSSAIYGSRGANGVIAVYTKRGKFMKKGILETQILAYYHPREFYSPKYGSEFDYLYPDDRITLFWAPTILTDSLGHAETVFYSSDRTGTFEVSLEGIGPTGHTGESQSSFKVN